MFQHVPSFPTCHMIPCGWGLLRKHVSQVTYHFQARIRARIRNNGPSEGRRPLVALVEGFVVVNAYSTTELPSRLPFFVLEL